MPDQDALDRRLSAVERTLADGEHDLDALRAAGDREGRIASLEDDLADARDRIAELEAATQALRGYVGNVRAVNDDVAERADAALAAVEDLEDRIDEPGDGRRRPGGPEFRAEGPSGGRDRSGQSPGRPGSDEASHLAETTDPFDAAGVGGRGPVDAVRDGDQFDADGERASADGGRIADADDGPDGGLLARIRNYV
ncbi:DUF7310 family coiled-coil domain-containing protein [Halomicrobium salinisoli]|uniref:DUF7310 family coiled-coil domain-containing protein n=1 Tax=Halomicrobium salinisoli TaxID=2878391 RepID=UPI001CEFB2F0|nr:hypothetical protein [Halomicrobium salinisoli]